MQLKIDNENISIKELSKKLGLSTLLTKRASGTTNAWIHREKVDTLIEQLNTGNLDGIKPVASLGDK